MLAVGAPLFSLTEGLAMAPRINEPRVVSLNTARRPVLSPIHRDKLRRRGNVEVGLDNEVRLAHGIAERSS